ncbi:MAG TPA: hypothetical protein VF454_03225, partial [Gemmatimonadales bacterium]
MIRLALLALLQQPATPAASAPIQLPARVARVVVEPADAVLIPGDTLRLRAVAYDSAGAPLPTARIGFFAAGGQFEGTVSNDG